MTLTSGGPPTPAGPVKLPVNGDGLRRFAHAGHFNEIGGPGEIVGGVEIDPANVGYEKFCPGMGRGGALIPLLATIKGRRIEVTGREAGSKTEHAGRLHHEECIVAAGARAPGQKLQRL